MSKLEELIAQAALAHEELSKQAALLRGLRLEVERTGETLDTRSYSDLRARIELQEMRTATATRRAREKQTALDEVRSAEVAKLQREAAQRAYDDKLAELNTAHALRATKVEELRRLRNEIPFIEQRASLLLWELDRAKDALRQIA